MLKIYIYWHKCWCYRCGTGRTTSEDSATQLLICEPLSFANSDKPEIPRWAFLSICRVIFNEYYSWYSIHHLSVEGVSRELSFSKLLNEMKCSKKWKCAPIKLFDVIKVANDFCKSSYFWINQNVQKSESVSCLNLQNFFIPIIW